ncbi:hypothetical protein Mmar10_2774 [Maricaulis maris MCS10]|uniref:Uncharacterized protein n=1 Tax=Maricaulis maris (strain MCS10) TaxID=394221 RepID=Q0AKY7_MARMM|nr:hypothetical protein Mmar10_2774 [Maricaulis maris MCS10]
MDLQASGRAFSDTVAGLAAWAVEEVRRDLPRPVLEAGRRVIADRYDVSSGGQLLPVGQVLRSWLGTISRTDDRAAARKAEAGHVELVLPGSEIFRTRVDVNAVISRRGDDALRARLQQHSPLPQQRAVLAYSLVGPGDAGRVLVDVAVAHRARVEEAARMAREKSTRWQVVADRPDAKPLIFADSQAGAETRLWHSPVVRALVVAAAVIVCLAAVSDRYERQADRIEAQRDILLVEARDLRLQRSVQAEVEPALLFAQSYTGLGDLLDGMADAMTDPDMPDAIARLDLQSPDALRVLPTDPGLGSRLLSLGGSVDAESGS